MNSHQLNLVAAMPPEAKAQITGHTAEVVAAQVALVCHWRAVLEVRHSDGERAIHFLHSEERAYEVRRQAHTPWDRSYHVNTRLHAWA